MERLGKEGMVVAKSENRRRSGWILQWVFMQWTSPPEEQIAPAVSKKAPHEADSFPTQVITTISYKTAIAVWYKLAVEQGVQSWESTDGPAQVAQDR